MVLVSGSEGFPEEIKKLMDLYGISTADRTPQEDHMVFREGRVSVVSALKNGPRITLDYGKWHQQWVRDKVSVKKNLLCRAVGLDKNPGLTVIDGTLGLGRDSMTMVFYGAQVTGIERDPVLAFLVEEALWNAKISLPIEMMNRLSVLQGDSQEAVQAGQVNGEVLYLDPMFENAAKKSLPGKEMAFVRKRQVEYKELPLDVASLRQHGFKRVVVKRSLKGDHLWGEPTYSLSGKMVRFDIY